ncbi:hypothetical protein ME3_00364 [Bartonella melophagi K-2C]|uniref:Uncharacterized protein n=1 Tax=Bartonella melophagi K-2C TaxID=1094557 RepID=J0ZRH5_9HYPH|nr:hypothetical protein ME3_00364 [Bartonella melophagi K-2C]
MKDGVEKREMKREKGDDEVGWEEESGVFVYMLPIRIPVARTNAPPTMTWKEARQKGVAINLF